MENLNLLPVSLQKTDSKTMIPSYVGSWMNWRRFFSRKATFDYLLEIMEGEPIERQTFSEKMAKHLGIPGNECPICRGKGITDLSQWGSNTNFCFCSMIDKFVEWTKEGAEIECSWNEKNLGDFKITQQRTGYKQLVFMVEQTKRFMEDPTAHWLLMSGTPGAGKSFMIEAIRTVLGEVVLYMACQNIATLVHNSMKSKTLDEVVRTMSNFPILALDDYGAQYEGSAFTQSVIAEVLDYRYRKSIEFPTIISTNLTVEEMKRLDARTASRMLDQHNSMLVDVSGVSDYRAMRIR